MRISCPAACFAVGLLLIRSAAADVLYNLDFTPPDTGTYQVTFGSPTVQSSVGPFTDALVFHAVTTYDQIQLSLNSGYTSYDVQCDVLMHNVVSSKYDFSVYLDTPEIRYVSFNGLSNILGVYQPNGGMNLGAFANDTAYHLDLAVDLARNRWTVAVNGVQQYANTFNAANLQDIRFSMAPAAAGTANAPSVYAALDNVVVTAVPEAMASTWLAAGLLAGAGLRGFRRRPRFQS